SGHRPLQTTTVGFLRLPKAAIERVVELREHLKTAGSSALNMPILGQQDFSCFGRARVILI
ncbi:MAG: hypothetical protein WCE72_12640, partial [Pseudolabrys sp.]